MSEWRSDESRLPSPSPKRWRTNKPPVEPIVAASHASSSTAILESGLAEKPTLDSTSESITLTQKPASEIPMAKPVTPPTQTSSANPGSPSAESFKGVGEPNPLYPFGLPPQDVSKDSFDVDDEAEPEERLLDDFTFFYGIPSWMVSFIVHLVLIILLALCSIAAKDGTVIEFVLAADSGQDIEEFEALVDLNTEELEAEDLMTEEQDIELTEDFESFDSEVNANNDLENLAAHVEAIDGLAPAASEFTPGDGKSASFFGIGAQGKSFVFVVDCSGSMADEYRWDTAKRELKLAIRRLTTDQKFYVFLYNQTSYSYRRGSASLMAANDENKQKIFKWLDRQRPDGDTRPWRAMRTSLRLSPSAIFLLSDGELKDDTVVKLREENVKKERRGKVQEPVTIHTISLGNGFGSMTMKAIASQNGGSFTQVSPW